MRKIFKKPCLICCFLVATLFLFQLISINVFSKTYAIKDKDGNVVKMTSTYKMSQAEKEAGYTISVLYEDKFPKEELNPPPGSKLINAVLRVIDGDTIEVYLIKSANFAKIRLNGIDCPEKGQSFYEEATTFTSDLCLHQQVRVIKHDIDKYKRLIADIILLDGKNLSEELVRAGYAWWYHQYSDNIFLKQLESEARNARRGLWSQPNPIPPWEFRNANEKEADLKSIFLDASVSYNGTQFIIENNDDFDWLNVKMEVNGTLLKSGFILRTERMEAGVLYTAGALQFAKNDGTKFNPFYYKPNNIDIYCQTPDGDDAFWSGSWE